VQNYYLLVNQSANSELTVAGFEAFAQGLEEEKVYVCVWVCLVQNYYLLVNQSANSELNVAGIEAFAQGLKERKVYEIAVVH
jgi:hypothetical protein